jgi:hypothetical protein
MTERYRRHDVPKFFRGDASVADPKQMTVLENLSS